MSTFTLSRPAQPNSSADLLTSAGRFAVRQAVRLCDHGVVSDALIRAGIRRLLQDRLRELSMRHDTDDQSILQHLWSGPIAVSTDAANEQHYELPASFYQAVLGPHLKYSCGLWPNATSSEQGESDSEQGESEGRSGLEQAEAHALMRTCRNAQLEDGQRILEIGCGWGSLSLWMAEHYPSARITAVSNSHSQRHFVEALAAIRGLTNLQVITADINEFEPQGSFDRVVSVEMFEHCRNHALLLRRILSWLEPDGRLLVHIFCHRSHAYLFEDRGPADWMSRHFFTGGIMPSHDLLSRAADGMEVEQVDDWNGEHYQRTSNAWLAEMDRHPEDVRKALQSCYGSSWKQWRNRWRIFFMACAELFGFNGGTEWFVTQQRIRPVDRTVRFANSPCDQ
ncbi:MAG: class I SAM-dependent methyltransferase [Planctomycetaceae bacterium]|nr:class I SAM-dependent methyltransferase [Planctomycetaceae bacterium]